MMSSFVVPSSLFSSTSNNSIKGDHGLHQAINTQKALTHIEDRILLPYQDLDLVWKEIQVFWLPLRGYNKEEAEENPATAETEETNPHSTVNKTNKSKKKKDNHINHNHIKKNYTLPAARPPDSSIGVVSEWRWCHMGIILVAKNDNENENENNNNIQLQVLIDLHNSGIRIHHVLIGTKASQQQKMHDLLYQLMCSGNNNDQDVVPIYSAGVQCPILPEQQNLSSIRHVVQSVRSYNVVYFNCQHFTSIAYQHFTGLSLRHKLRQRWTSSHRFLSSWSNNNSTVSSSNNSTVSQSTNTSSNTTTIRILRQLEEAASQHDCLKRLQLVDAAEDLVWSYTPKFFGKTNQAALVGGLVLAAAAPLTGLAVTAMGVGYDKVHPTILLSRSTIWFTFQEGEWQWSPYRCGDFPNQCRWMSVRHLRVRSGPYEGQCLQKTAAQIVQTLHQLPIKKFQWDCPVCWKSCTSHLEKVSGSHCTHAICIDCFKRLAKRQILHCPF